VLALAGTLGYLAGARRPRIWMHGASAGDLLALRDKYPIETPAEFVRRL